MALENGLLIANVAHARQRPKRNAFHYGVYYLCFALEDRKRLKSALMSLNVYAGSSGAGVSKLLSLSVCSANGLSVGPVARDEPVNSACTMSVLTHAPSRQP